MMKKVLCFFCISALLLITGCGGNENEKPKDDNVVDNEKSIQKKDKMSVEETKALVEGQVIESIDEKTPVIPDPETLEAMGYDYEYVIEVSTSINGGDYKIDDQEQYWYNGNSLDTFESSTKDGDKTFDKKYVVKGTKIIPIVYVYEENGKFYKKSQSSDNSIDINEFINPDNYQTVQETLINRIQ